MKVVHFNTSDIQGGAARAAKRINSALVSNGVNSKLIVLRKESDDKDVLEVPNNPIKKVKALLGPSYDKLAFFTHKNKLDRFVSSACWGFDISDYEVVKNSDTINLHWINNGFLSIQNIDKLMKLNKRFIWTIHDSWLFTGGCHVTWGCDGYLKNCGESEVFCTFNRISRKLWVKKKKLLENANLTVVTPSKWLAEKAKSSSLLKDKKVEVIPNCLDTSVYKPIGKKQVRKILNLPVDRRLILFVATGDYEDKNKGFEFLRRALLKLNNLNYSLLIIGANNPEYMKCISNEIYYSGKLHDDYSLSLYYNAADVYVGPSLEEAFGQTYTEAMACSTPCLAFDYSGPKDIIDHKENGYLAKYNSVDDIVEGIKWILENERYEELCQKARIKVEENYTYNVVSKKYLGVYGID